MRSTLRLLLMVAVFFGGMTWRATLADAACPPGSHWSDRSRACVTNQPPSRPPGGIPTDDRKYWWTRFRANCLTRCQDDPACQRDCDRKFKSLRQKEGW